MKTLIIGWNWKHLNKIREALYNDFKGEPGSTRTHLIDSQGNIVDLKEPLDALMGNRYNKIITFGMSEWLSLQASTTIKDAYHEWRILLSTRLVPDSYGMHEL